VTRPQQEVLGEFLQNNPNAKIVGEINVISSRTGTKEMLVFSVQEKVEGVVKTRSAVLFCNKQ